jgi:hypothetical protein
MNDKWKAKFGREDFFKFVMGTLAVRAFNGTHDGHVPWEPTRTVTREAMLGQFLTVRPDLKPFRAELVAELARSFDGLPEFYVNRVLWDQLVPD